MKKFQSSNENSTLVVSPEPDDERVLSTMLERESWRVRGARSFREALRVFRGKERPLVVTCESELPDGSWRDVFQFLATKVKNPPPLVVVSRQADEALWAEVLNVGGYDVLLKPFDGAEVHRVMNMARLYGATAIAQH
jgi:DNA-binding response OmpR family regulator